MTKLNIASPDLILQLERLGIEEPPANITVKLSGDGAVIAASSTMVFLTFSFPGLSQNVLSARGK